MNTAFGSLKDCFDMKGHGRSLGDAAGAFGPNHEASIGKVGHTLQRTLRMTKE